ncbi:MAG: glycogen debranching enzyme GlgX [Thalassobius sp.]|nr:glycogen debranching enzyme GlgX [Thalassovita sp.]
MKSDTQPGKSFPLGATYTSEGVNFCVFSKNCQAVELLFFNNVDDTAPSQVFRLDSKINKTFYYWHIFIPGIKEGQLYGYRVYGNYSPEHGNLFDGSKLLLDPYAKSIAVGKNYDRHKAKQYGVENAAYAMKSVVINSQAYNWEGDKPLQIPYSKSIIYELHVAGFTKNANSGVSKNLRGTYLGLIEKIPYLKELGITAVELLPVHQFDHQDAPNGVNYWGYSPIGFFSPHHAYGSTTDPVKTVQEFKDMVKALHKAGIEVILDVVYNHTSEGGITGVTQCFKGYGPGAYYTLNHNNDFSDFTGCGNSLNANHSIVRRMIMDSLNYWVSEMHIDGFRFDLASVLSRDENGIPLENPPILWEIESEPILAGTKVIAEAWDAAGLYQVGSFIGDKWSEWNGKYRDDVRRFMKSDKLMAGGVVQKILGSPDLFYGINRDPNRSINFVTCHDGFTLNDLVSYNEKHNELNEENNRDGMNENFSWNCGVEGHSDDENIDILRLRQIKNFFTILMVSQGTPMLLMGDEVRRTQNGNNNAYCQDNEISWFDWDLVKEHDGLLRFVKTLINDFFKKFKILHEDRFWEDAQRDKTPHITWHGTQIGKPDWGENSHSIAFTLGKPNAKEYLHVMVNAYWGDLDFELPLFHKRPIGKWKKIIDTAETSPKDIIPIKEAEITKTNTITLKDRSIVVLYSEGL